MRDARLGIMAFATDTGLGVQTRALYDHLRPAKTIVVDLSKLNGMPLHPEWYPDAWRFVRGFPTDRDCAELLDGLDSLIICETPLNYRLFELARQRGVRTVLQPNPEFFDYFNRPGLTRPAMIGLPSAWMEAEIHRSVPGTLVQQLPVPIELAGLPQRTITQARRFFHIAGRPAVHDRNGTLDFIAAAKMAARHLPEAVFTVYCQQPTLDIERALRGSPIRLVGHVAHPADMYLDGDVLVLPRRYGGLCLPAREAVGCGIPVLMPAVSPNTDWLPSGWLVPVTYQRERFMTRTAITIYHVNIPLLAQHMVDLYLDDSLAQQSHREAQAIAQQLSWDSLLPLYEEVMTAKELAA